MERFRFLDGFITDSKQFFDVDQSWPLAVTLWRFEHDVVQNIKQELKLKNYSDLKLSDLKELIGDKGKDFDDLTNWGTDELFRKKLHKLLNRIEKTEAKFNIEVNKLKSNIPPQSGDGNKQISLEMIEKDYFIGGLCFPTEKQLDSREEKYLERVVPVYEKNIEIMDKINSEKEKGNKILKNLKKEKYPSFVVPGHPMGINIGFTEGKQPYRTEREFKNDGKNLFFLMDTRFIKMHTSQCLSGVPPKRGHVINSLDEKSKNLIIGYAMAHSLSGNVPSRYNQFDMWLPEMNKTRKQKLLELSGAFTYAHNSCIECEIPANHPEEGVKRSFVTNPLSNNKGTFWNTVLHPAIKNSTEETVLDMIEAVDEVYSEWKIYIQNNPRVKAKAKLPIYTHPKNKTFLDGWGLFQIEKEVVASKIDGPLLSAVENKKEKLKRLRDKINSYVSSDLDYWNI